MAGFKTTAEQSKWDALQGSASSTIDKLLHGAATPEDITKLSKIIAQQSTAAQKLFDDGVASAEATADAIVDKMNKDRIALGKNALSGKAVDRLFKQTFQKVLSASTEDILGSVHDLLEEQTDKIQESLDTVAEQLEKIKEQRRARETQEPTRTLADRVGSLVRHMQALGPAAGSNLRRLATPARGALEGVREFGANGIRQFGNAIRNPRQAAGQATTYIKTSITAMKDAVVDGWRSIKKRNEDDDEDKTSSVWLRKLKGMFGNVKEKFDKGKKATSWLGKLFGPIGKVLLLALTNPQLIKTITDAVSEYLNFDSIEAFVASTWKDIKKGGSDIVDWVIDKVKNIFGGGPDKAAMAKNLAIGKAAVKSNQSTLAKDSEIPANTTIADARLAVPRIESDLKTTQANLDMAKKRLASNPSEENKMTVQSLTLRVQKLKGQLGNYNSVLSSPTAKPADVQTLAPAPASGAGTSGGTDSTAGMPTETNQSRSTVVPTALSGATGPSPASIAAASSASTTAVGTMPQFKDGLTIEAPKTETAGSTVNDNAPAKPAGGIVSLGSFGFQSGDDTLNLLNMGLIG